MNKKTIKLAIILGFTLLLVYSFPYLASKIKNNPNNDVNNSKVLIENKDEKELSMNEVFLWYGKPIKSYVGKNVSIYTFKNENKLILINGMKVSKFVEKEKFSYKNDLFINYIEGKKNWFDKKEIKEDIDNFYKFLSEKKISSEEIDILIQNL